MSAKSQFLATNTGMTEGDNLLGSLNLAMVDVTRGGWDAPTTKLVGELKTYADANSNGQRFGAYIAKITPEAKQSAPTARASVKMGTGMM